MVKGMGVLLLSVFFMAKSFHCYAGETEQKMVVAKEKVGEAGRAVVDYAYSQKEVFVEKTKNELIELKKDLESLEYKAKQSSGTAKTEAQKKIQEVKAGVKKLNEQMKVIKNASESEWDEIKIKYNTSVNEVKDAIEKSRRWMSEKIAP